MADKNAKDSKIPEKDTVEAIVPEVKVVAETNRNQAAGQKNFSQSLRRLPMWGWVIVAIVAFFALIGLVGTGFAAIRGLAAKTIRENRANSGYSLRDDQSLNDRSSSGGYGMMERRGGFGMMDDNASTGTRVSGVVTVVDGDTITVAGNGTTTKVKVTSSTTYIGAAEPAAVNDTITAFGTTSDGVLTATSIRLVRQ